jgi:hypothetical protein
MIRSQKSPVDRERHSDRRPATDGSFIRSNWGVNKGVSNASGCGPKRFTACPISLATSRLAGQGRRPTKRMISTLFRQSAMSLTYSWELVRGDCFLANSTKSSPATRPTRARWLKATNDPFPPLWLIRLFSWSRSRLAFAPTEFCD